MPILGARLQLLAGLSFAAAIGRAALSAVAASGLGSDPSLQQIADGDRTALIVAAGLAAVGALVALAVKPPGRRVRG